MIIIAGPTSSGKSALAVSIAQKLQSEVISLDAVQVYKECDIGSGKVTENEQCGVRHHLLSIFEPTHIVSAPEVVRLCNEKIGELSKRNITPIISAGSTMYLTMLLHGFAELPKSSGKKDEYSLLSNDSLYELLLKKDPKKAALLHQNDRQRVMRALEVIDEKGVSIEEIQNAHQFQMQRKALVIILCSNRDALYDKIESRCEQMIQDGFIDEVRSLYQKYAKNSHALRSIGYAEFVSSFEGKISINEAKQKFIQATKNYAKRQMTYLRNEPVKRHWKMIREDLHTYNIGGSDSTKRNQNSGNFKVAKVSLGDLLGLISERKDDSSEEVRFMNIDTQFLNESQI